MLDFKLFENVAQAKSFLRQNNIPETDSLYQLVRKSFKGKEGYVGWITKLIYRMLAFESNGKYLALDKNSLIDSTVNSSNIINNTLNRAKRQFDILLDYLSEKEVIDKLEKPVIEYETFEQFVDAFIIAEDKLKAKRIYDEFPAEQKKLININIDYKLLKQLHDKKNKKIFIKKISSYHDRKNLISRITAFINEVIDDNFNNKIKYLKNNKLEIVHQSEKDNIIIAKIFNYQQCSIVGAETSWCIARDSNTYSNYIKNDLDRQYIIYLTDKPPTDNESIIGVTFKLNSYYTAHYKDDAYLTESKLNELFEQRKVDKKIFKIKKSEINEHNIKNVNPYGLFKLGFTKDEIINKKGKEYLTGMQILLLKEMGFTKDEIKEYSHFRDPLEDIKKVGFTEEEIEELVPNLKQKNIEEFIEAKLSKEFIMKYINFDTLYVHSLLHMFTKEEILNNKQVYVESELDSFNQEQIKKYDLNNKVRLDGYTISVDELKKYIKTGEIYKIINRLEPKSIYLFKLINAGLNLNDLQQIKNLYEKLIDIDRDFYKKHCYKPKEETKTNEYRIYSSNTFYLDHTIKKLKIYNITPDDISLEKLEYVLNGISHLAVPRVVNFLIEQEYSYTEQEIKNFLLKIIHINVDKKELFKSGIEAGINFYPELMIFYLENNDVIDPREFDTAKNLLSEKYPDKWEIIEDKQKKAIFIKHTLRQAGYLAIGSQYDDFGDWDTERKDYALNLNWKNEMKGENEYLAYVATIIILALNDDWESLYKLPQWDWGDNTTNVGDSLDNYKVYLSYLVRTILGANVTKSYSKFRETDELTKNQISKIYTWIMNYVWPTIENKEQQEPELQLAYYLLDKKRWNDYLQRTKKKKMNYFRKDSYWISYSDKKIGTKEIKMTYRFYNIAQVVEYLCNDRKYINSPYYKSIPKTNMELDKLLFEFTDGITMGKKELKKTISTLYRINIWNDNKDRTKIINDIFNKYIPIINESIMTNYDNFIYNLKFNNPKNVRL